jgi:D-serine deaminase-like pyridoxal phosphate-dependent protein
LPSTLRRLVGHGVSHFKCATSLELVTACEAGATDVVVAYPVMGANARRVRRIAERFPDVRMSALVESEEQLAPWIGSRLGLLVDINPGMNRTGADQEREDTIVGVVRSMIARGIPFRGLHYYDGHMTAPDLTVRAAAAHRGYDHLLEIVAGIGAAGYDVEEVITAGTPALPCSISYGPFETATFAHRVSPGTVVYNDLTSLSQLPAEYGYRAAALVLSTVVSRPSSGRVTCDAGHKTVSADAGIPTCAVAGRDDLVPGHPSEEHLPIDVHDGAVTPALGELLHLVPRHVCPTVNNFDHAVFVSDGKVIGVEEITARGREHPQM